jgi:hypothetical protein
MGERLQHGEGHPLGPAAGDEHVGARVQPAGVNTTWLTWPRSAASTTVARSIGTNDPA